MADLNKLLDEIQKPEVSHVDMIKRRSKGTLQWFLEKDHRTHPIHDNNALQFFMCGQEGFAAIEKDILAAGSSIDLVLWGFDPGMELTRSRTTWPHGTTYGDLLVRKAGEGVKVRMLLWFDSLVVNKAAGNVPDFPAFWAPTSFSKTSRTTWPEGADSYDNRSNSAWVLTDRSNYCKQWWEDALAGRFKNLEVRLRRGSPLEIHSNLARYLPDSKRDLSEAASMIAVGTHHQKPILIDYEPAAGGRPRNVCGYVMGLNSVTDYWDTTSHAFNDPRRELSPNSYTNYDDVRWHRKPYRDYAIRVQGEALHCLNRNFVQGWDSAAGVQVIPGPAGSLFPANGAGAFSKKLGDRRQSIQARDIPRPSGSRCRVQIQRTQPESDDGTILKGYTLASANALNYIYVENQYFQLSEWPRLLKDVRRRYRRAMQEAGAAPTDMAPLHLFVVIPQPERGQMVPSTYDTVGTLGAGAQMGEYDKKVQGERKRRQAGARGGGGLVGASANTVPVDAQAQLQELGIKPLVAMLLTFDSANQAKNIRVKARDSEAQDAQAGVEEKARGHADDVDPENLSDFNIMSRRYREIYIHSKLMIVDDVYLTLGSANLNARSMAADSELNLCTEEYAFTKAARKRVWGNLAGDDLDGRDCTRRETAQAHEDWLKRMKANGGNKAKAHAPENNSFIHLFEDPRGVPFVKFA